MNMYRAGWAVLQHLHDQRRQNLIERNYNPDKAAVPFDEFAAAMQYRYNATRMQAAEVRRKFVEVGYVEMLGGYMSIIKRDNKNG